MTMDRCDWAMRCTGEIGHAGDHLLAAATPGMVASSVDSLDAAWAEAEAALPDDDWEVAVHRVRVSDRERRGGSYIATGFMFIVPGPTPAPALRSLTEKLRERTTA